MSSSSSWRTSTSTLGLHSAKHEMVVYLDDFVIPNPELVPDEVRRKIQKWSDYVDYWASTGTSRTTPSRRAG